MPKEKNYNPVQAQRKADKAREVRKGKQLTYFITSEEERRTNKEKKKKKQSSNKSNLRLIYRKG